MLKRLSRWAVSLITLVVSYWLYALLAVPLIEPTFHRPEATTTASVPMGPGSRRREELKSLFPPGSWQLETPKVLETEEGMLLFQQHQNDQDRLELKPCSLVLFGRRTGVRGTASSGRALVLDAPEGALLSSETGIDLSRGHVGQISGGRLLGEIKVRSPATKPDGSDALEVVTRNIQIDQRRIWTVHEVRFRYGESQGSGRDLEILLSDPNEELAAEPGSSDAAEPAAAVASLELVHLDRIQLMLPAAHFTAASASKATAPQLFAPAGPQQYIPIEVTCRGSFLFHFAQRVASFDDQVRLERLDLPPPHDQLLCDQLAIHFAAPESPGSQVGRPRAAPGPAHDSGSAATAAATAPAPVPQESTLPELLVAAVVAEGSPVAVDLPSVGAAVRARRVEYNFGTRTVAVKDPQGGWLQWRQYRVETEKIEYQIPEDPGRLGLLRAEGRGVLRSVDTGSGEPLVNAGWGRQLTLQPQDGEHVISLYEAASFEAVGQGNCRADALHVWLREAPGGAPPDRASAPGTGSSRRQLIPTRFLADGQVSFDSPRLAGGGRRVEAWLERDESGSGGGTMPMALSGTADVEARPSTSPETAPASADTAQKFQLHSDLIRLKIAQAGRAYLLRDATLAGQVRVAEVQTARTSEVPLQIQGEMARIRPDNPAGSEILISGNVASVSARGMTLRGENIELDRRRNLLWINGPGQMQMDSSSSSMPGASPSPRGPSSVVVAWQQRMEFDGQLARMFQEVRCQGVYPTAQAGRLNSLVCCPSLDVRLTARVDFRQPAKTAEDPRLMQAFFHGDVLIENHTLDAAGGRQSWDRMQMRDLTVNQVTGETYALGPGWLETVRRRQGNALSLGNPLGPVTAASAAPAAAAAGGLEYLRVDFARGAEGNLLQRQVSLFDQIRAVYGPVGDWNERVARDRPSGPAEGDVLLTSDRLRIADLGAGGETALELEALGNASVEGRLYRARAHRMSYAAAKELLVLLGEGQQSAEIWQQKTVGGEPRHFAGQRIQFWRATNEVQVHGFQVLELGGLGTGPSR